MDFLTAAHVILEEEDGPLHFKDITSRASARGLLASSGVTPEATMGSRLYVDTKKEGSRFERVGRGRFALKKKSEQAEIARRVEEINDTTRQALHKRLHALPADRFEALIGELLIAVGFEEPSVQVTSYSNDGGIDVRGVLNAGNVTEVNAAVQVKRWKRNVRTNVVRELRGSLTTHEQGIIMTTSDFSSGARAEANATGKAPISLINGKELIELLVTHSIGVNKEPYTVIVLDEEWWNEASGEDAPAPDFVAPAPQAAPAPTPLPSLSFPLTVRAINAPEVTALMIDRHGRMEMNGDQYASPSSAGKVASGWKSCNGWFYWRYQHPDDKEWRPIDDLRG